MDWFLVFYECYVFFIWNIIVIIIFYFVKVFIWNFLYIDWVVLYNSIVKYCFYFKCCILCIRVLLVDCGYKLFCIVC